MHILFFLSPKNKWIVLSVILVANIIGLSFLSTRVSSLQAAAPNTNINTSRQYTINVLSLAYYPIASTSGMLDTTIVNNNWGEYNMSLTQVQSKVDRIKSELAATLSDGTKFRNYKSPNSAPVLTFNIVDNVEYLQALPESKTDPYNPNNKKTDYITVLNNVNICNYVDNLGVKEVWLWGYTGLTRDGWESNFASPTYGDISNSDRDPYDMPVCQHSYTLYEYNYGRDVPEAMEDHMHQYESIFRYVNYDLFWNKFVGYYPGRTELTENRRRCGWAHYPPNGMQDYDWTNTTSVSTDCMAWNPNSYGKATTMNCTKWGCNSKGFFTFWMQSIPGMNNGIQYGGRKLRNWWDFIGNFDQAMSENPDLVY